MSISETPDGASIDLRDSTTTLALLRDAYDERLDLLASAVRGQPVDDQLLAAGAQRIRDLETALHLRSVAHSGRRLPKGGPDPSIFLG